MKRRQALATAGVLGSGLCFPSAAQVQNPSRADPAELLRVGGCVVLMRHAQTDPGVGDPPDFQLGECSTQRNLSAAGRAQSVKVGEWFRARGLVPARVESSAWCRCVDTAQLAFGRHTVLSSLNSTFGQDADSAFQTSALRQRLAEVPPLGFWVWISHQVNITALTGESARMGEAVIVGRSGQVLLTTMFA